MRGALSGDLPHSLSVAESTEAGLCTFDGKHDRSGADIIELCGNGATDNSDNWSCKYKQNTENDALWKQRIRKIFRWSGKRSLEIYMLHDLVLKVLMLKIKPVFPDTAFLWVIFYLH